MKTWIKIDINHLNEAIAALRCLAADFKNDARSRRAYAEAYAAIEQAIDESRPDDEPCHDQDDTTCPTCGLGLDGE